MTTNDFLKKIEDVYEKLMSREGVNNFFKLLKNKVLMANAVAKEYGWLILFFLLLIQTITENTRLNTIENSINYMDHSIGKSTHEQTQVLYHIDSELCHIRNHM